MNATVSPPISVRMPDVMAVSPVVLTVDAAMPLAFVASASTVSPSCWTMSNRADEEATPASASLLRTLNRAALRWLSEVTHTVPSSSWTCLCVTEPTMIAPATMPSSSASATIGVVHAPRGGGGRRRSAFLRLCLDGRSERSWGKGAMFIGPADLCRVVVAAYGFATQAMEGVSDIRRFSRTRLTWMQVRGPSAASTRMLSERTMAPRASRSTPSSPTGDQT